MSFAKLYENKDVGQILVLKCKDDEAKPCIKFGFTIEDLGLDFSSIECSYTDNDQGFDDRDAAFEKVTEALATELVTKTIARIRTSFKEEQDQG